MAQGSKGWYTRGYLPHWDAGEHAQFLTWRLHDALPAEAIERMKEGLAELDEPNRKKQLAQAIEAYCDQGHGSCVLNRPVAARAAQLAFFSGHMKTYVLHARVVMPNHAHVLVTPVNGASLADVVQKLKGGYSHAVNKALGRTGRLWQPDYHDRLIRDEEHFAGVIR